MDPRPLRDLHNVRLRPADDGPAPLTDEEEQRFRALLFTELGNAIADRGWARYPAYTPQDRRRLVAVADRLTAHWGQRVHVQAEDPTRLRLSLSPHAPQHP
ncbi:hypothetical protein OG373_36680 [Streptomyces avidinii]|uniref:hypothetical protein n=1 Tax=Streptomyces avidinii TaxID=1895 RepID=UPI00386C3491|nr:hypothetical protein OG373_36680 [Streptomyces avidinii]